MCDTSALGFGGQMTINEKKVSKIASGTFREDTDSHDVAKFDENRPLES